MLGKLSFSSSGLVSFAGLASDGVTAFASFLGFAGAGIGVNGAGVISSGVTAALLSKQACAAHPANSPFGELRQLHPVRTKDKAPTISVLMHSHPHIQSPARISCERYLVMASAVAQYLPTGDESLTFRRAHTIWMSVCALVIVSGITKPGVTT